MPTNTIVKAADAFYEGFAPIEPTRDTVVLELPYPAVTGNHATKHTRSGHHYKTVESDAYDQVIRGLMRGRTAPEGRVCTDWLIAPPDLKARDFDNLSKVVKDALTKAGFWADDSNKVIEQGAWKWTDPVKGGRILLSVTRVCT